MTILIADDHAIVRQGLRSLIDGREGMQVVGEAQDGQTAVRLAQELSPDVVIMDITMPDLNGVEATRKIVESRPEAKVIVLSMHPNRSIIKESLRAGARGYVLKSYLFDELHKAMEVVSAGGRYLSPRITEIVVRDYAGGADQDHLSPAEELTSLERELLQHLAEGRTVKQVAKQLHVSPKTVDARRRHVMNKLGMSNASDLVKYALREGLTSLDF